MKDNNKRTYEDMKTRLNCIGRSYRESKRRVELCMLNERYASGGRQFDNDLMFVRTVDILLKNCDRRSQFIIRNEYLTKSDPDWYLSYYSPSVYYRSKKKAVTQFDRTYEETMNRKNQFG